MIRIETERLIIRDNIMDDLEGHHKLMSDPNLMTYIQDIQTHSLEESKKNLAHSVKESKSLNRTCYFFAIEEKEGHNYVGAIGFTVLERTETNGNAELGYFILKDYWSKGYTTEACKAVIDYAFNSVNLHKISTGCNAENVSSEKIMIKLGMTKEAHLKQHVLHNGQWKDRVEYGLFREDYV
jgi:ribosomal-protein-alanine N-acetyltransferase